MASQLSIRTRSQFDDDARNSDRSETTQAPQLIRLMEKSHETNSSLIHLNFALKSLNNEYLLKCITSEITLKCVYAKTKSPNGGRC